MTRPTSRYGMLISVMFGLPPPACDCSPKPIHPNDEGSVPGGPSACSPTGNFFMPVLSWVNDAGIGTLSVLPGALPPPDGPHPVPPGAALLTDFGTMSIRQLLFPPGPFPNVLGACGRIRIHTVND